MKKFCLLGIMAGLLLGLANCASAPRKIQEGYRNEPDGFRGIKWGADLSGLPGFVSLNPSGTVDSVSLLKGVELFVRDKDDLHFEKVNLSSITYSFWKNKFFIVDLHVKGMDSYIRLRRAAFDKFGKPSRYNKKDLSARCAWHGQIAFIGMEFWESLQEGSLMIYSKAIMYKLLEEHEKSKTEKIGEEVSDEKEKR